MQDNISVNSAFLSDNSREPMENVSIFIGSSKEGLDVAQAIELQLQDDGEVTIWKDGVFGLSIGTLESLVNELDRFDFGILVLTPDDVIISRDITSQAPRDNVMFEIGLFMGRLGRSRTFVVCSDCPNLKLPSDLAGVSITRYNAKRLDGNLRSALSPSCTIIRTEIRKHQSSKINRQDISQKDIDSLVKKIGEKREKIIEMQKSNELKDRKIEALHGTCVDLLNQMKSI